MAFVAQPGRGQGLAKRLGIEMRMHPRSGISPHVGDELDALTAQQADELLQRPGGVADGPDKGGLHPRGTLAGSSGSATICSFAEELVR